MLTGTMWTPGKMRYERQSVSHIRSWCPSRSLQRSGRMWDLLRCLIRLYIDVVCVSLSAWTAGRMRYERQSVSHIRSWCPSRSLQRSGRMWDLLRCLIRLH